MTESGALAGEPGPGSGIRALIYGADEGKLRLALTDNAPAGVLCRSGGMLDALDDLIEGHSAALVVVEAEPTGELVVDVATFMSVAPAQMELLIALERTEGMIADELLVAGATAIVKLPDDMPRLIELLEDKTASADSVLIPLGLIDTVQDSPDRTQGRPRPDIESLEALEASFALPATPPPVPNPNDSPPSAIETGPTSVPAPAAKLEAAFDRLWEDSARKPGTVEEEPASEGDMAPAGADEKTPVVHPGKLVAVVGAAQGVGATSVALSLACLGAKHAAEGDLPVPVVVDLDPYFGDMMLHLNMPPGEGFLDLLRQAGRVDQNLLELVSQYLDPGFRVLACQADLDDDSLRINDDVVRILSVLREGGGLVVADLPRHDRLLMRAVLMQADSLVIVFDGTPPALRDAIRIEALAMNVCSTIRVTRVLSHARSEELLDHTEIARAMGRMPDFELVHDHAAFKVCLETGKPLPLAASHAKPMRELTHLFGSVVLNECEKSRAGSSWFSRLLHFGRGDT